MNLKTILSFLATIPPGNISINNLAGRLGIDSKTTLHYLHILHNIGLARLLNTNQRGTKLLRSPEKVFLRNTTLLQAICNALGQKVDVGAQRELAFVTALTDAGKNVYCSKKRGDFTVDDTIFEIGGKNKTGRQIHNVCQPAFLVKNDVLTGGKKTIPLYLFGFLYKLTSTINAPSSPRPANFVIPGHPTSRHPRVSLSGTGIQKAGPDTNRLALRLYTA